MFVYIAIIAVFATLISCTAHAWGPGLHVETAFSVLGNLAVIAPAVAVVIKRFPDAFIYGAASPDIIVGKKYAGYLHHCHNWRMGWLILNEAETERQRASAYGYLMHLAADVVAHNYYIPVKIVRSHRARLLTHTYWEMRFDLGVREAAWKRLKKVRREDVEEFDGLLERVLKKTLFSFSTNKRIFNTILMLQKMRTLRSSLKLYAALSRYDIVEENRRHYVELACESAMDFLKKMERSVCLHADPAGLAKLTYAKNLRRRMNTMRRRGLFSESQAETLVEFVKERLALAIYRPNMILPDVVDVIGKTS